MKTRLRTLITMLVLAVAIAGRARAANPIVDWNQIALTTALTTTGTQLYLTYVHLAMYDAVNAIDGRYQQYGPEFHGPRDASGEAAAISAAYQTLLYYFPAQSVTLQSQYDSAIAAIPDGQKKASGIAIGQIAAARIVALRTGDGRNANVPYTYPTSPVPGVWIPTPPTFVPPVPAWVGQVVPFTMQSASQFLPANGPPDLGSAQWAQEYNEVKLLGAANSSVRTAAQTEIALFWTANPVATFFGAFRQMAIDRHLNLSKSARLLAMLSVAFTDGGIGCFNAKYHFSFWRPVTAIPNGDLDGNPDTEADPTWLPLAPTPPHPEFPAAHGCATGAIAGTLENFFGTPNVKFSVN
ncbi:MAG TPA: vanadium-dependent haloperoxidase, partial [Terriglobales bacterium]|nr:vanadium-dependent haloperoxidase [Terriglobales bacterium]